jgi:DNA-binding transcriptional MocR family regulator
VRGLAHVAIEKIDPPHGYSPAGTPELRQAIAARLTREGVPTAPEEVLVTTGAQQALSLIAGGYLRPGDAVVVEDPGFPNAFDTFRAAGGELLPVSVDSEGIDLDALEELCAARPPRLVYVTATHQSPTGAVLGNGRRYRLARIAERYRITVVEDTALAEIGLADKPPPPHVARFAPDAPILLIGSMSKLFWGGLRVGWIRAARPTIHKLMRLKLMADIGTPLVSQLLAAPLIARTEEARGMRHAQYAPRLERLAQALRELVPDWSWSRPAGGFTLWARLPDADASAYAALALRHGVAIAPGPRLSPEGRHADCVRIAFMLDPPLLEEGVERLASAWADYRRDGESRRAAGRERVFV